jgi:ribosomal RNA-processing protein 12
MAIVEKLHRHLLASNRPAIEMMHTVVAGLAGKTPMLVAGTIVVMAKLLWVANDVYSAEDVQLIVDMVCELMEHIVPEVRSGAVSFMRMCLKLMKRVPKVGQAMEKNLQRILNAVALIVSQPQVSSAVRTQMRQLTEKLLKRFGDRVEAMFPVGSLKFVQHVAKTLRRTQRLKLKAQNEDDDEEKAPRDEFAETFLRDAADGEEDDAEAAGDDLLEGGGLLRMPSNRVSRGKFFEDDEEEEVGGVTVRFDGDKLMILSAEQRKKEEEDARRRRLATELLKKHGNSLGPNLSKDALEGEGNIGDRRKRSEVQDFENDELVRMHGTDEDYRRALNLTAKTKAPSSITVANRERHAEARDRKRQRFEESGVKTGDEFQSTRALGDVKKGNVDPFAYVPLHPKYLNRRHAKERTERLRVLTGNRGLRGEKAIRALQAMKGAEE